MFDVVSQKLQSIFQNLKSRGKLTEENIASSITEIRRVLLEADVNYKVVKDFINTVKGEAVGEKVLRSVTPGHQIVKIVHDALVRLVGETQVELTIHKPLHIIMLVGLQGCGKTTTCAKLSKYLKKKGRKTLLVSCDTQRPAAMSQLKILGEQHDIPVYEAEVAKDPVRICRQSVDFAKKEGYEALIIDTAGRLHIDDVLMAELKSIKGEIIPQTVLFVIDAMAGQDAVNVAQSFNESLNLDGVILTKLDGDTRGGAAISVKQVTGKPIVFIGVGEHIDDFEPFYPDRMVSRILGMGDIVSLVEKAQAAAEGEDLKRLEKKMRKQELDLEDFLIQLKQIRKMGPLENLLSLVPAMGKFKMNTDGGELEKTEAIINSMTVEERKQPHLINGSRKQRIARGSGTAVSDINILLKNFFMMGKMMGKMSRMQKEMNKIGGIPWQ